jgi:hypothetical protein
MTYIPETLGFYNPEKLPIGTYVPYAAGVSGSQLLFPRPFDRWVEAGTSVNTNEHTFLADLYKENIDGETIRTPKFNEENSIFTIEYDFEVEFDENDWQIEDRYRYVYTDSLIGLKTVDLKTVSTQFATRNLTNEQSTITSTDFPSNEEWWIHEVAQYINVKLMSNAEENLLINEPQNINMYYGNFSDYNDSWFTGRSFLFYNPDTRMHMVVLCHAAGRRKLVRTTTSNETTTSFSATFSGRGDGGLYINTTEYLSEVVPLKGKYAKLTNFNWVKESPLLNNYEFLVEDYEEVS